MKTLKFLIVPTIVGFISSMVTLNCGFKKNNWQYWLITITICVLSFIAAPIHQAINSKK